MPFADAYQINRLYGENHGFIFFSIYFLYIYNHIFFVPLKPASKYIFLMQNKKLVFCRYDINTKIIQSTDKIESDRRCGRGTHVELCL